MANLKYGSTGDEVKQLQQALVNAGYDIGVAGVDGSFGPDTHAAVMKYQTDNGLQANGVVDSATIGSLYRPSAPNNSNAGNYGTGGFRDYTGTTYQSADYAQDANDAAAAGDWERVLEALSNRDVVVRSIGTDYGKSSMQIYNELLQQYGAPQVNNDAPEKEMEALYGMLKDMQAQLSQPMQSYEPSWGDSMAEKLLQQAVEMNYEDWTQGDQYAALADRFSAQGRMTMQDVLGQISSRTGGLASSYATTAAQQQYNDYMAQLEEVARQRFASERDDVIQNAQIARDYGQQAYERYVDQMNMQNDRNSTALGIINQLMGYTADQINDKYNRGQAARAEAQERINAYLAAYGSIADLDPALIEQSGYTQSELRLLESYFAEERAATLAPKGSGGGGGSTGSGQKPTLTAAQTLSALQNGIINDTTKAAYEYYYGQPYDSANAAPELEDTGEDATISNRHGDSWIYIPGQGRLSYQEVEKYVNSGQIIESYNASSNTYSYKWNNSYNG